MGSGSSKLTKTKHIFANELKDLHQLVSSILTSQDTFVDPNYNFLFEDVCKNYTLLWEKELNKHLKIELEDVAGALYLVPKKDLIHVEEGKSLSKLELCNSISRHYAKILYVLSLVKHVYDLEENGDNSLAGIVQRNIRLHEGIMEVNYCSIPHKDFDNEGNMIDFSQLHGMEFFAKHFLSPVEKHLFIGQMKKVFDRSQRYKIENIICNDELVPITEYNKIYENRFDEDFRCEGKKNRSGQRGGGPSSSHSINLMFNVVADNPILHSKLCMSPKKILVMLNKAGGKDAKRLYDYMWDNYNKNISKMMNVLEKMTVKVGHGYRLKNLTSKELEDIIKEVKHHIIVFYVQSIVDYQALLDYCKKIDSIRVSKN
jgi:hypothetical protein